jgi:tRNA threonylcarbamoyl adenosine modification protein YeaZ
LTIPLISPPTHALAIHTSSPDLGLALQSLGGDLRYQVWALGRDVSNLMHQKLSEFLCPQTCQDLAWVAVAIGPGGFTGTRIGVVAARTLAQQLDIPLFGISSLAVVAQAQGLTNGTIALEMPAHRGELHTAIYQKTETSLTPILSDRVMTPEAWQAVRSQPEFAAACGVEVESAQGHYVTSLLELAQQLWCQGQRPHWSEVLPFYGQHPVVG